MERRGDWPVIRVLVADDHTIVRQGLVSLVEACPDCRVVAQAQDGYEAVTLVQALQPDVAVIDVNMPRLSGLAAVPQIQALGLATRMLVLTMHEEKDYVINLVKAGAAGYLLKDSAADELIAAIKAVAQGRQYFGAWAVDVLAEQTRRPVAVDAPPLAVLTSREREVFRLITEGRTTKQIAATLRISAKTAENHRGRILNKLAVHNTAELMRFAAKQGLL